jgi:hypothetical protein
MPVLRHGRGGGKATRRGPRHLVEIAVATVATAMSAGVVHGLAEVGTSAAATVQAGTSVPVAPAAPAASSLHRPRLSGALSGAASRALSGGVSGVVSRGASGLHCVASGSGSEVDSDSGSRASSGGDSGSSSGAGSGSGSGTGSGSSSHGVRGAVDGLVDGLLGDPLQHVRRCAGGD